MRRALTAAAILLALAAPAAAVAADGEPVVGGGSFATAPVLEGGKYRDTLLPAERLFYGVQLEPGQQLRVRAELLDDGSGAASHWFAVGLETPAREVVVNEQVERDIGGHGTITRDNPIEFVTPPVRTISTGLDESGGYNGPGVWYVSLYLPTSDAQPPRREFPVALELEILGAPQPDGAPDPTPQAPRPAPSVPAPRADDDDDDGAPVAGALAVGGAGLLAGLLAGALAGRRRRG